MFELSEETKLTYSRGKISTKLLVISIVIGLVIGFVLGLFVPLNPLTPSPFTLKVQKDEEMLGNYTINAKYFWIGKTYYSIEYTTDNKIIILGVFGDSSFSETFDSIPNTYKVFGAEITISEVHDDYIIVKVTPI